MNLPDIEWKTEQLTTNQYTHVLDQLLFLDTLANTRLQQIANFPTRNNNTLDVVLANRLSLGIQCVGMIILVVWFECRFLVTEVDGSNPGNSMLFP